MSWLEKLPFTPEKIWTPVMETLDDQAANRLALIVLPATTISVDWTMLLYGIATKVEALIKAAEDPKKAEALFWEMMDREQMLDQVDWLDEKRAIRKAIEENRAVHDKLILLGVMESVKRSPVPVTLGDHRERAEEMTLEDWLNALIGTDDVHQRFAV